MADRELRADCANCFGLCCVALPFAKSADFAIDKPAGDPCPNLQDDYRCGIHSRLRMSGFQGCTAYDCFGAGQRVSQSTFGNVSWRSDAATASLMFQVFPIVRQLHEMLWYLGQALRLQPQGDAARRLIEETDRLADSTPEDLQDLDLPAHRALVNEHLLEVSRLVRRSVRNGRDHRNAQMIGARMRNADLRGADMRGAYLIAADLRDADLSLADLIGADLRDADLRGADLATSLFLNQAQVNGANGDRHTRLPVEIERPQHWDQ